MPITPLRFPFVQRDPRGTSAGMSPVLPLTLHSNRSFDVSGLLDTGSSLNVLPHQTGLDLGADWDRQKNVISLTGNLAQVEARILILSATVGNFAPVKLAFAWIKTNQAPLLLGQVNFFMEFNVCFFRDQSHFEVAPK